MVVDAQEVEEDRMTKEKVLIIDDEKLIRWYLRENEEDNKKDCPPISYPKIWS